MAGAILNVWFVPRREKSNRKRAFRSYIKGVQCDLDVLVLNWKHEHQGEPYFLYDWQKKTASKIAAPCAAVLEDIPAKHQDAFMGLLMQFSRQGARDVEPYEGKQPGKPLLYSEQQKTLGDILEGMIRYAK